MVAAVSPLAFIRRASAAWSAVSLAGRPNLRPDFRACSSLRAVRSRTSSRSYSAMDIRIPATIRPVLVEGVHAVMQRTHSDAALGQLVKRVDDAAHVAAQPVQSPDDQGVALTQIPHALGEAGPVVPCSGRPKN